MGGIPTEAINELIKASPFAAMCVLVIILLQRNQTKSLKTISELFDKTLHELKDTYEKVYKQFSLRQKPTK